MHRTPALTALVTTLALTATGCGLAGGGAPTAPTPPAADSDAEEGMEPYPEVVTATAVSDDGLFDTHRVGDDLLFEIPDTLLGRELLLVSRRARTADGVGYGGEKINTQVVRWERVGDRVLLRVVSYENVAADSLPIYQAVRNSNFEPVLASFDIRAISPDSAGVVIEVTELYTTDVRGLGLARFARERYEIRGVDEDRSFISRVKSFPRNVEVRAVLTYEAISPPSNASTGTISLEINHSMVVLPTEPMMPRLQDDRVGYFSVEQVDYGRGAQRAETRRYINRWRLVPSDSAAWLRGEVVTPAEPIVYYIDPATPRKWRPYLEQGVEDWQPAFEEAGFRDAIIARDPPTPEEDPEFSPEDVRYSVIRYFASPIQNAYGPHVHDPRTGEILESDIGWYHNIMNLVRNWYFVQTAAANPEARRVELDDEVMGRLIRYIAAHEVGHTLGLPHNMRSSFAYPVDSLRTDFSCRMGTAPSIMDYARFNYVAQPGDDACFMPRIGPYDRYAIRWGYGPVPGADSPDEERPALNALIRAHDDDPVYRYTEGMFDPAATTEAVGDDAMRAGEYGMANLRRIVPRLLEWTYAEGEFHDPADELYDEVLHQWSRYAGHVAANIGGIYDRPSTYDQDRPVYTTVPEPTQRRAMEWLGTHVFRTPDWLLDETLLRRIDPTGPVNRVSRYQARTLEDLLTHFRLQLLIEAAALEDDDAYTLGEMLADLRRAIWAELETGRTIDVFRRQLQRTYLERLEYLLDEEIRSNRILLDHLPRFPDNKLSRSDVRPYVRAELRTVREAARGALDRAPDDATRVHLQDVVDRIGRILDPPD